MTVPRGWYEVASDLTRGAVTPTRVGDRDLVAWRDADGDVHVAHAHCPHLGAHLGYGGTVHDHTIRCPFHGWEFGRDGACVAVPYRDQPHPNASLVTVPVAERAGAVFAWIGDDPFELPEFSWFARSDVIAPEPLHFGVVRALVEDFVENAADTMHFETVHHTAAAPVLERYDLSGPVAEFRTAQQYATPRGAVSGRIDIDVVGAGMTYTTYEGLFTGAALATFTPVPDGVEFTLRFRFAADTPDHLVESFVAGSRQQIEKDFAIWAHRVHHARPAVVPEDGPILELRQWLAQFRPS